MQNINFLDREFDKNNSKHYNLSIQACPDGFSFSIFNTITSKTIGLKSIFSEDIHEETFYQYCQKTISEEPLLKYEYNKVSFLYSCKNKAVIPNNYFNEEDINSIYSLHHSKNDKDILVYNKLKTPKVTVIFGIDECLYGFLKGRFNNLTVIHHSLPLLLSASASAESSLCASAYVNITKDFFDIIVIKNNSLQLINSYSINSQTDIPYYILNTLKSLDIKTHSCKCILSGIIDTNAEYLKIIKKYIKHTDYSNIYGDIKFIKKHNINGAYYANLLNLEKCV